MSSSTWTPHAVASDAKSVAFRVWRAVEAQHVVSTMRLVDFDLAAQRLLEEIVDESKPGMAPQTKPIDYLLFTPFRYRSPFPSRFRGADELGVFYGADEVRTACAELGYWRWRFVMASEGLRASGLGPTAHTVFRAGVKGLGVDLRVSPFDRHRSRWTQPDDYRETQALARAAREATIEVIRYESVRDPEKGGCAAVLRVEAFQPKRRLEEQTWHLTVTPGDVIWQRDGAAFQFDAAG